MTRERIPTTFVGSDGNYYTAAEVARKMATDAWRFCMRDRSTERELFETERGELLLIVPTKETDFGIEDRPDRR
ncbi:MAG: hypothetical protein ACI9YT_002586 [Halobacteriales archaeon]|jgi:hypothetical protein